MPGTKIDVTKLVLDELGRAVLSDDLLDQIENSESTLSAGGSNLHCPGTTNGSCTNGSCAGSSNEFELGRGERWRSPPWTISSETCRWG